MVRDVLNVYVGKCCYLFPSRSQRAFENCIVTSEHNAPLRTMHWDKISKKNLKFTRKASAYSLNVLQSICRLALDHSRCFNSDIEATGLYFNGRQFNLVCLELSCRIRNRCNIEQDSTETQINELEKSAE